MGESRNPTSCHCRLVGFDDRQKEKAQEKLRVGSRSKATKPLCSPPPPLLILISLPSRFVSQKGRGSSAGETSRRRRRGRRRRRRSSSSRRRSGMGKGQGCVPSKSKRKGPSIASPPLPSVKPDAAAATDRGLPEEAGALEARAAPSKKLKLYIIFYSMYGHVEALAKRIKTGVDSVEGAEGFLFRVEETLPHSVLENMHAPPKDESIPIISVDELPAADAVIFGFPTRYGAMASQMKAFFDSTGKLWHAQQLAGKPAGIFVSTGTQGGGQETTAWTAITQLAHHGMLFVPIGYTFGAAMFKMDDARGGSPYGAGTFAGDGTRRPSEVELALAEHQGRYIASVAKRLVGP